MVVFAMNKPRLLLVELHHLGDAVMSLPFVRGASEHYEVHILCRPVVAPVFQLLVKPPHIHEWEPPWAEGCEQGGRASLRGACGMGRQLREKKFDVAVCAWADARCGLLMAKTRVSRRVGFPMTHGNYYGADLPWRRKRRWLGHILEWTWNITHPQFPMLTNALHRDSAEQAHMRCWEQIAKTLNISCNTSVPWLKAPTLPGSISALTETPIPRENPILLIHPHARLPSKQWPLARWRELLRKLLISARYSILEIVPPGYEPLGIADNLLVNTPDVATLTATLDAADAVLCHDSFPAHLAAALGKPVITIFGSGEPDWFAPWNNRHRVVQQRVCPLHPCLDRCGMDSYLCLDQISVADVLQQLELLPRIP